MSLNYKMQAKELERENQEMKRRKKFCIEF
jgi:hypothetical protein